MSFITGVLLIDAPASALNNAGPEESERNDNKIGVKKITVPGQGQFPYVSAQSYRYWLRTHLERQGGPWTVAPMSRESKIAYTDGNPLKYWDDDLFGYMRAESKKEDAKEAKKAKKAEGGGVDLTPTTGELTRVSPLRVGTFVALAPTKIVDDFGTMSRHDGNPVPHEHQFYRATLRGSVSVDLTCAGTFFFGGRVGYKNLDDNRQKAAAEAKLEQVNVHNQPAYRLPVADRAARVATLVQAVGDVSGGAKQTLHHTDVAPVVFIGAVMRGGNNPFYRAVTAGKGHEAAVHEGAVREIASVFADDLLSPIYVGWTAGYADGEFEKLKAIAADIQGQNSHVRFVFAHPREALRQLAESLKTPQAAAWFA
ncbi:MAG: type I-B CRISPR-associated protein Cas7/Cst2/DevR [Polyangiaceae bacterium]|nr:type I-B CRISPR-associated protein Cas7/Cst2/DevR [Polyangiaceae bacterium]